jgi:hypothetical protein
MFPVAKWQFIDVAENGTVADIEGGEQGDDVRIPGPRRLGLFLLPTKTATNSE